VFVFYDFVSALIISLEPLTPRPLVGTTRTENPFISF